MLQPGQPQQETEPMLSPDALALIDMGPQKARMVLKAIRYLPDSESMLESLLQKLDETDPEFWGKVIGGR